MREHSRFEKARVIGARALQISMGAPVDIKVPEEIIDPVIIAQMEYDTCLLYTSPSPRDIR